MISLTDARQGRSKDEYYVCCPQCINRVGKEDTGYKLGINIKTGVYNCYRCNWRGKVSDLSEFDFYKPDITLQKMRDRVNSIDMYIPYEDVNIDIDEISYPLSKVSSPNAYKYLSDRNISQDVIDRYGIRVGQGYWRNRIVIPYYVDGVCKYVIGRTYVGNPKRYINTSTSKYNVVYGIDQVVNRKAILCEGVFSAIAAFNATGIPAMSMLGKYPTDGQMDKIRGCCDMITLTLDGEVTEAHKRRVAMDLKQRGMKVRVVDLPYAKDPDDLRDEFKQYYINARRV